MKNFAEIIHDVTLNEDKQKPYKAIFNQDGQKVNGSRSGKMLLGFADEDGNVTNVTWKQFKASNLPWSKHQQSDDSQRKKDFIMALLKKEKQFNKKVDYNSWHNKNKSASFEDKVDKIFELTSARYSKSGIK
jgi:hypothetical protein